MAGLVPFLFVAGSLWAAIFVARGSVLTTCALYLVAASVLGVQFLDIDIGVSLSIDRIVLLGVLGMYGLRVVTRSHDPKPLGLIDVVLGLFFVVLVGNTLLHDFRYSAPGHVPILPHLIEGYLIPVLLYWIARNAVCNEREVNRLYGVLTVFAVYLAITALLESAQMWSLVFPRYISDPQLGIHFGRARGPFLNSVRLGIYLSLGLGMTWIALMWRGMWGRAGHVTGVGIVGLLTVAIVLTYTRSAWLGVAVAALVVSLLTFKGVWRRMVVVLTMSAVLVVGFTGGNLLAFKREYTVQDTAQSTTMRAVFAYVSWLMFQDKPITGFGFGHYQHENHAYLNDRSMDLNLQMVRGYVHHNTLLSVLVELGLLGFIPFVALIVMWCRTAWRLWRLPTAPGWMRGHAVLFLAFTSAMLIQMVFHDTTYSVVENGAFYLCAGLLSGMAATQGLTRPAPARFSHRALNRQPLPA